MTQASEARARRDRRADRRRRTMKSSSRAARPRRSTSSRKAAAATEGRDRVLLSAARASLQHRAVAARRLRDRRLPADRRRPHRSRRRRSDADRTSIKLVAFAHVSNVLGSILDAKRAADSRTRSARSCCSTAARRRRACRSMSPRSAAISTSSRPQDLRPDRDRRAVGARRTSSHAMPPWQGGGAMIDRVTFEKTTYLAAPSRFEAGTPHIVGAIGFHAAIDWTQRHRPRRDPCA